jgi:glycosyltransferase involved in cell wall biosynthesis
MSSNKVSIITVVKNRVDLVGQAISSVQAQSYPLIEHVIVDGASTDGTIEVAKRLINDKTIFISESDRGIYDALNKGVLLSTGDIIGVLHSDDCFSDDFVIAQVAELFEDPLVDLVYADLEYVSQSNQAKIIRRWSAGQFSKEKLAWGWMPPHPTVFFRRRVYEIYGGYDLSFKISGDYDFLLRILSVVDIKYAYLQRVIVMMRVGGKSNNTLRHLLLKMREDYRSIKKNKIGGLKTIFFKNLLKLHQFI